MLTGSAEPIAGAAAGFGKPSDCNNIARARLTASDLYGTGWRRLAWGRADPNDVSQGSPSRQDI
jgi:hypothetical protein